MVGKSFPTYSFVVAFSVEGAKLTVKKRIGVVDNHPAMLLGVTAILNASPDLYVVATAATVAELLHLEQKFDLILLDLELNDGSTPSSNIRLLAQTGAAVLASTAATHPELIREANWAGIAGLVSKSSSATDLAAAVTTAAHGKLVPIPDWALALDMERDFIDALLSPREAEVLALYATGQTAENVASRLFISRETVLDHIRRIRTKYARAKRPAPTKVDLFRRAVEDGLIAPR